MNRGGGGVAQTIDSFLANRKSPLAGKGKVFVAAGRKYGVDPRLVVAISGIESSFGKHILGNFNAWGWGPGKPFGSWEEGITTVTKGLRSGYLDRGLKTPEQIVHRYAPGSDGNDTGNWVRVVNQFLGEMGGSAKNVSAKAMTPVPVTTPAPMLPPFDPSSYVREASLSNLLDIARTGKADPQALLGSTVKLHQDIATGRAAWEEQQALLASMVPNAPSGPAVYRDPEGSGGATRGGKAYSYSGKTLVPGVSWNGTHITDNLDWNNGRRTAIDIMADPGTPIAMPIAGTIIDWGSAQGGESLRFRGVDGSLYWLGHIEQRLPVGTRVKAGQPFAVISGKHSAPHLHIDRKLR